MQDAGFQQTQNQVLREIESVVRACRRKQSFKREAARYLCCGGNGKSVWANRKFGVKLWLVCVQKIGAFALSYKAFLFFQDNFLFSQKQIPIKLPLFIKHITYYLPKSKHAFYKKSQLLVQ